MFLTYLITNTTNGKQYVGITQSTLQRRFNQHVHQSKSKIKWILHESIAKHGKQCFTIVELEQNETKDSAFESEKRWISELQTLMPKGYNMTPGGEIVVHSEETRRKMSQSHKGKKFTKEHIQHMKENHWSKTGTHVHLHGKNHPLAKRRKVIDDKGNEYFLDGNLVAFCDAIGYSRNKLRRSAATLKPTSDGWQMFDLCKEKG
jgi:group I intron endonuclease